jgi:hypothetical protein
LIVVVEIVKQRLFIELDDPTYGFGIDPRFELVAEPKGFGLERRDYLGWTSRTIVCEPRGLPPQDQVGVEIIRRASKRRQSQSGDDLRRFTIASRIHRE